MPEVQTDVSNDPSRVEKIRIEAPKSPRSGTESVAKFSAAILGVFALLGLMLTFFGFGVALSLDLRFGIDMLEVLTGPSDYLAMSSVVIVSAFNLLYDLLHSSAGMAGFWLFASAVFCLFIAVGTVAALVWMVHNKPRVVRALERSREWATPRWQWVVRNPWTWRPAAMAGGVAAAAASLYALCWVLLFVLTLAVMPFWIGLTHGDRHFYESVVEPYHCAPLMTAQRQRDRVRRARETQHEAPPWREPREPYLAACVEVKLEKHGTHRGRRIIATSEVIALYNPVTGDVLVLPKKDAVVSKLDKL